MSIQRSRPVVTQPESESGSGVYNNEIGSIVVSGSNADG